MIYKELLKLIIYEVIFMMTWVIAKLEFEEEVLIMYSLRADFPSSVLALVRFFDLAGKQFGLYRRC